MPKCDGCKKILKKGSIIGWGNWLCDSCYLEFKEWLKQKELPLTPANIQQQVPPDKAKLCTKIAGYTLCDAYSDGKCNFAGEPCR